MDHGLNKADNYFNWSGLRQKSDLSYVGKTDAYLKNKPFSSDMSAEDAARYDDYWRNLGIGSEKTWNEYLSYNPKGNIDEYFKIIKDQSPWPNDFIPQNSVLLPGDKFNIVLDSNQPITKPGRFATTNEIKCIKDVRNNLAVKVDWKQDPKVVVSYVVNEGAQIPVLKGLVGPQLDLNANCFYPGGYNQLNLLLGYDVDMMKYLNIGSVKIID
ncbi:hypothetical protein Osc1_14550 [Hominimerdicola sp. 21CYCFAH17_S]